MSSTKIVIICLVILMAIFFVGLSLNLIDKPDIGGNSSDQEQQAAASEYSEDSWLKSVDGLLSPFAESITPKELSLKNCSKTGTGFILNKQSSTCKIIVTGFSETFKKLSLKPSRRTAKLKITYKPVGEDKEEFSWPAKDQSEDNINFVILGSEELQGKTAATINLECTNCTNQTSVKIAFE